MKQKISEIISGRKFMIFVSFLGLYLLSTGTSWALFSYLSEEPGFFARDSRSKIDTDLPRTEACPISGELFSKPEKLIWEERRPITAIIENHVDSRPQSGLSYADVVYEAVAEGGITRFLAVFYCGVAAEEVRIAPIRSARVYYIDWAAEYGRKPIFVHIGGANSICGHCPGGVKPAGQITREVDAFNMLERMNWRAPRGNAFDGGTNVGYPIVVRDQYRLGEKAAWEHSVVAFTDKIFDEAEMRGFGFRDKDGGSWNETFHEWKFADDNPLSSPRASKISFAFWSNKPDYDVSWEYEAESNRYLRINGGKPHVDLETEEQISAKNIVIQFVNERGPVDKELHMFYTTIGTGEALIFQNGDVVRGSWEKRSQLDRTKFFDSDGREIEFVRGPIWIGAVPSGNRINY